MRKLHPLLIRAEQESQYLFLFRSAYGDREFSFKVCKKYGGIQYSSPEFSSLIDSDMSIRCIAGSIGYFDLARTSGVKFGFFAEKCEPIAIEYKGSCSEGAFKYLVSLRDTAGSVHTEDVVVSYKDPENVILWSGGQCSFGFDRMAMLEVKDLKPECVDLLNAILQFDQSRYLPSYENEEPMKIEL